MVTKYKRNLLPLLAVTAIFLSVGLVNFTQVSDSKLTKSQSVLSDSDENKVEDAKREEKKEEKKEDIKKEEIKERSEVKVETRLTTGKIDIEIDEDENENEVEDENESKDENDVNEVDDKDEAEFETESETASSDGTINKFKFKLKTKIVKGKTIIETASGEMEVKNNPEDSVDDLLDKGVLDTPTSFEAKTNDDNKVEFEVQGIEIKKLLGLFEVNLPKTVTIDSETGTVINTNQNIWTKILSILSI